MMNLQQSDIGDDDDDDDDDDELFTVIPNI